MSVNPSSTAGKPENCRQNGGEDTALLTHFIYVSGGFSFETKMSEDGQL